MRPLSQPLRHPLWEKVRIRFVIVVAIYHQTIYRRRRSSSQATFVRHPPFGLGLLCLIFRVIPICETAHLGSPLPLTRVYDESCKLISFKALQCASGWKWDSMSPMTTTLYIRVPGRDGETLIDYYSVFVQLMGASTMILRNSRKPRFLVMGVRPPTSKADNSLWELGIDSWQLRHERRIPHSALVPFPFPFPFRCFL